MALQERQLITPGELVEPPLPSVVAASSSPSIVDNIIYY
jgi:hypothetical protein